MTVNEKRVDLEPFCRRMRFARSTPNQNYTDTHSILSITLHSAGRGVSELEIPSPFRHRNFLEVECPDSIASSVRLPSISSCLL